MPGARTLAIAVAMGLAWTAHAEPNAYLARARAELDALKFQEARASLAAALRAGGSTPDETAEIHRLSGQVAATLGDAEAAEDHFRRYLALEPGARLPSGTSPKLSAPFSAALARTENSGPLRTQPGSDGTWPPVVRLVVDDPVGLVDAAEVRYWIDDSDPRVAVARGKGTISVTLPLVDRPALPVRATVAALDRHGNRLVEHADPIVVWEPQAAPPSGPVDDRVPRPFYARPYTWAGVAVGFLAVGGYFAFRAHRSQQELDELMASSMEHDASEALAIQRRGEREAVVANINLAVGGAFALLTTILVVRDALSSDEPAPRGATALPAIYPGGAGVVLTGRF